MCIKVLEGFRKNSSNSTKMFAARCLCGKVQFQLPYCTEFIPLDTGMIWNYLRNSDWLEYLRVIILNYCFVIVIFPLT
jgi:hypothetical protein